MSLLLYRVFRTQEVKLYKTMAVQTSSGANFVGVAYLKNYFLMLISSRLAFTARLAVSC